MLDSAPSLKHGLKDAPKHLHVSPRAVFAFSGFARVQTKTVNISVDIKSAAAVAFACNLPHGIGIKGEKRSMQEGTKGIAAMLGACLIWGCMPLIYKPLVHVASEEVLAHRVIWSLVFFATILLMQGRGHEVRSALSNPRQIGRTTVAAAMISVNWFLIIFATAVGRNTESSLGYYIYPLFAVLLGRVIFAEKMVRAQTVAVALAVSGVTLLALGLGTLPWIALAVAITFSWYGVIKKTIAVDALVSVTAELVMFLPFVLFILVWVSASQGLAFGSNPYDTIYMIVAGPVTALPLILFSYAARRVRMSTIGLMQYINPTLQFLTAVVLFAEPFTAWHAIAFGLIWVALAIYSVSAWGQERAFRKKPTASSGSSAT